MPSTSKKQHNFMAAIAHSPAFAKKVGVPQSVGKDFSNADKGRKFSKGGDTMATKMMGVKKMAAGGPAGKTGGGDGPPGGGGKRGGAVKPASIGMKKMASGGSASSRADGVATKGKTKGTFVKMNKGGMSC